MPGFVGDDLTHRPSRKVSIPFAPIVEGKLPEHIWLDVDAAVLGADEHVVFAVAEDVCDEVVAQFVVVRYALDLMGDDSSEMRTVDVESLRGANPQIVIGIFAEGGNGDVCKFGYDLKPLLGDVVTADTMVAAADPQYVFVWTVIERRDVVRKQPILHVVVGAIACDDGAGTVQMNQTVGFRTGPYIAGFVNG